MGRTTQTLPLGAETSVFLAFGVTECAAGLLGEVPGVSRCEEDEQFSLTCVVACQARYILSSWGGEQKILLKTDTVKPWLDETLQDTTPHPGDWAASTPTFLSLAWQSSIPQQ